MDTDTTWASYENAWRGYAYAVGQGNWSAVTFWRGSVRWWAHRLVRS